MAADHRILRYGSEDIQDLISAPLKANTTVYNGEIALLDSTGYLHSGSPSSTDSVIGIISGPSAGSYVKTGPGITSGSTDGDVWVDCATGAFVLASGTGADALTEANSNATIYVIDSVTVGATSATGTRPSAGIMLPIDPTIPSGYVPVQIDAHTGTGSGSGGGSPTGAAGGNLGGTYPNPTVTGLTIPSEARGDILFRGASAWVRLPTGTSGQALKSQGAGADLVWGTDSTIPSGPAGGDLGGTYPNPTVVGFTIPSQAQGDILYRNSTAWVRLPAGTSGQVLKTQGAAADPIWSTDSTTPSGAAGGDLNGTYPNPGVAKWNGTAISTAGGSLVVGQVPRITGGGNTADWGAINLALSASVTGLLPFANLATITAVNGTTVGAGGALSTGAVLRATGAGASDWGAVNLALAAAVTGVLPVANLPSVNGTVSEGIVKFSATTPGAVGTAAVGTATTAARSDHVHAHGNQGVGANFHILADGTHNGFMQPSQVNSIDSFDNADWEIFNGGGLTIAGDFLSGTGYTLTVAGATSSVIGGVKLTNNLGGTASLPTVVDLTLTSQASGDIPYFNGTNWVRLAAGAANTVLIAGTPPTYSLIANANVSSSAAIAGTKIAPAFGSQNITNTGSITCTTSLNSATLACSASGQFNGNLTVLGVITLGANAASGGEVNLGNAAEVRFRNAANSANIKTLTVDSSNMVTLAVSGTTTRVLGELRLDGAIQTTVGAAGGASLLPISPTQYGKINYQGTDYVIPLFAVS